MKQWLTVLWAIGILQVCVSGAAPGATVIWTNTVGTNDWFVGANWSGGSVPTNGDEVIITNANIGVQLRLRAMQNLLMKLANDEPYIRRSSLRATCTARRSSPLPFDIAINRPAGRVRLSSMSVDKKPGKL